MSHPDTIPTDPVAAATHADPYDYYAALAADRPFHRDPELGVHVACGAAAVEGVLNHPACRVRPAAEPIAAALFGSPAAEIFRHLARMNDGAAHHALKPALTATLDALDTDVVRAAAERAARRLAARIGKQSDAGELTRFAFALPAHVIGALLGVEEDDLRAVTRDVGELARCIFPGGTADEIEAGKLAAARLQDRFRALLARNDAETLLAGLAERLRDRGEDAIVANAIGLLVQAHDATAGLIGNTLLALAREPELRRRVGDDPRRLRAVVAEVLRRDPPIQNTRRFVGEPVSLPGAELAPGDVVLVLLAAANRDPGPRADAAAFDSTRADPRDFAFGAGPHACPARSLATEIAVTGVARLLEIGIDPERLDPSPPYRRSANARIPLLRWRRAPSIEHEDGTARIGCPR
ncbi:MAG TPA: cytochrome P450 [Longimicrobium sp.]|jgi:cytochrome P450